MCINATLRKCVNKVCLMLNNIASSLGRQIMLMLLFIPCLFEIEKSINTVTVTANVFA